MPQAPIAVLMSGAPGSGKSTLAALLSRRLRLPVIDKDRLRQATLWGLDVADINEAPWGVGLWFPMMESHLRVGVSVIGDMTLFRGVSESDVATRLGPLARLIQVFCRCHAPIERFVARSQADPLRRRDTEGLLAQVTDLAQDLLEPLDLGCPTFVVDTTDGYVPTVDELVEALITKCAPHLRVLLGE